MNREEFEETFSDENITLLYPHIEITEYILVNDAINLNELKKFSTFLVDRKDKNLKLYDLCETEEEIKSLAGGVKNALDEWNDAK